MKSNREEKKMWLTKMGSILKDEKVKQAEKDVGQLMRNGALPGSAARYISYFWPSYQFLDDLVIRMSDVGEEVLDEIDIETFEQQYKSMEADSELLLFAAMSHQRRL